jgi:hypothetical protein
MERIGGACEIDARPGAGTTVVLTVPAREAGDVAAVPKSRTFNAEQR